MPGCGSDKFSCKRSDLVITSAVSVETVENRFKVRKSENGYDQHWIDENEIYIG